MDEATATAALIRNDIAEMRNKVCVCVCVCVYVCFVCV